MSNTPKLIQANIDGMRCSVCTSNCSKYLLFPNGSMLCHLCDYKARKAARQL